MRGNNHRITTAKLVLGTVFLLFATGADANPMDDAIQTIAAQISADTGRPPEEFIDYATRLAKTLTQLSAEQQETVLGEQLVEEDPGDSSIPPDGSGTGGSTGGSGASSSEMLAAIDQDPPMGSSELRDYLRLNSPLDGSLINAAINRAEPMNSSHLREVLEANHPLTHTVLNAAIDRATPMGSSDLRDVLIQNSPLPSVTLGLIADGSSALSPSDLAEVLAAQ